MILWFHRLFCRHDWIYDDESPELCTAYWNCRKCGKGIHS
jgi:hypothetical protein